MAAKRDGGAPSAPEGEGWLRRSVLDEPRLSEVVRMYEEAGFEVRLENVGPATQEGCSACLAGPPGRYKVVYTRPHKAIR